ncbi:MAG: methionine adenosyltransferase [Spiroplasma poulsonii]|uniref:S-adenosylmethionine synthase n=1 Tax=Spiroplasma poulsonii TaxID=2138 RepID=A0A2P6FFZ5_9MOLU|nr:methionine adenosyltransferase [Spiroplasma poulsonii]KAF0850107.1 S-adenosylmethionine synthase [Spiroplasma poulsonii]MBW1242036.1 methionine adenosyltransferase [Spiroplasma poulsonii]PQM32284.1 S-adenosylmethionine synthase [Spiroplasma poulsonii]PWF94937.1 S-adenosylmethionine synthase [Spiroplasma poulsonii]PWF97732.1 S-adenosylmethionine synthase [Spiroplasma poulsonii]
MKKEKILFTSESVSEGHPDKICDQISDAVLDACLREDPFSRVACECFVTTNRVIIGGEITTKTNIDYAAVARKVLKEIGYNNAEWGIDWETCEIEVLIKTQSPDISQGVDNFGAGDQGIMFGYATNESDNYMPLAISLAHALVKRASILRKEGIFHGARPDMKSQVTLDLTNSKNIFIDTILMSIQHDEDIDEKKFKGFVITEIMEPVVKEFKMNLDFKVLINSTGRFVIGGPRGDAGLTGRKIIVDTYGGYARHGGGAFSGKDGTKVDRSAAYMARYVAKNIVAAGLTERCEIQLSYAIGVAEPISIFVETFGTNLVSNDVILTAIKENFDFQPQAMIAKLELQKPIYQQTATYGHFGRYHSELPWEKLDKVQSLVKYLLVS